MPLLLLLQSVFMRHIICVSLIVAKWLCNAYVHFGQAVQAIRRGKLFRSAAHTHMYVCLCVWLRLQPNNSCFNLHITLSVVCPVLIPISYKKSKCATRQCKLKGNTRKKNKPITDRISNCIINFALLLAPKQQQRLIKLEKRIEIKTSLQF